MKTNNINNLNLIKAEETSFKNSEADITICTIAPHPEMARNSDMEDPCFNGTE